MNTYTLDELSRFIDHTNLKANATKNDMKQLCKEALTYHFKMVAINQVQSALCAFELQGSDIGIGAAIAFPLGQISIEAKVNETKDAIKNGASEIDYVINLTELKAQNYDYIETEMLRIVTLCKEHNVISKVIFENCYLSSDEIKKLCQIAKKIKPDFIKTSTGFGPSGATIQDVKLMCQQVGDEVQVKAAGGIRDVDTFFEMIRCGAKRIGTSAGIEIINTLKSSGQSTFEI